MNILEKIGPTQKQHLGFILLLAVICFFATGKISTYHKKKIKKISKEIKDVKERSEIIENIRFMWESLNEFQDLSWDTNETVDIMGKINTVAGKHGMQIISFDPGGMSPREGTYKTLKMSLNIKGEHFNFMRFITELENLEMLTKINNIKVTPEGEGYSQKDTKIRATISIEAFAL